MTTPANPADLITWLRAQLDADEYLFKFWPGDRSVMVASDGLRIARWHPDIALVEVDAKRRILDLHEPTLFGDLTRLSTLEEVIGLLALPYADRPGYHEEWRPA